MPDETPILHIPYPIPDDSVDVPRDIKAMALAVDPVGTDLANLHSIVNAILIANSGQDGAINAILSAYTLITERHGFVESGRSNPDYHLAAQGGTPSSISPDASSTYGGQSNATAWPLDAAFWFDPADHVATINGKNLKLKLRVLAQANRVVPGVNLTFTMRSVGSGDAQGGTWPAYIDGVDVSGSNLVALASAFTYDVPTQAEGQVNLVTADFNPPAAGWYTIVAAPSGGLTAASAVSCHAALYKHHV